MCDLRIDQSERFKFKKRGRDKQCIYSLYVSSSTQKRLLILTPQIILFPRIFKKEVYFSFNKQHFTTFYFPVGLFTYSVKDIVRRHF